MQQTISKPAISRLCLIYRFLDELIREGVQTVSSTQIAEQLGINSHNVRKDMSYLGDVGNLGAGYDVIKLRRAIAERFHFHRKRNACVVGLGRLGSAILNFDMFREQGFEIVAGFDSNINRIETMRTSIALFPSHMISDIVRRFEIELAVVAVPEEAAQKVTDQLVEGGIKGIVNFSHVVLKPGRPDVFVRDLSILGDFHYLSALIALNENEGATNEQN